MFVVSAVGAVGRAGEQDRSVFCAFRHQDDGVQLDAVAHGDHDFAAVVVEAVFVGLKTAGIRWAGWRGFWVSEARRGEEGLRGDGGEQSSAEQKRGHRFLSRQTGDIFLSVSLKRCQSADGIICGGCGD